MNAVKILSYGKYFTPAKFSSFISTVGKNLVFIKKAILLYYCMRDEDTPKAVKALIIGGLGYLILPVDVVPDTLLAVGWLDDVAVLTAVMKVAEKYIKPEHRALAKQKLPFGKDI